MFSYVTRIQQFPAVSTNEAKLMPAFSESLLLLGKVDIFGATGTNARHPDSGLGVMGLVSNIGELSVVVVGLLSLFRLHLFCHYFTN